MKLPFGLGEKYNKKKFDKDVIQFSSPKESPKTDWERLRDSVREDAESSKRHLEILKAVLEKWEKKDEKVKKMSDKELLE